MSNQDSKNRRRALILWLILLSAFGLRIFAIRNGLPSTRLHSIEEDFIIERGMGILLGYTPNIQNPGSFHALIFALVGGFAFLLTHIRQLYGAAGAGMFEMMRVLDDFY